MTDGKQFSVVDIVTRVLSGETGSFHAPPKRTNHIRQLLALPPAEHRRGFIESDTFRWITRRGGELVLSEAALPDPHSVSSQIAIVRHLYTPVSHAEGAGLRYDLTEAWVEEMCWGFWFHGWTTIGIGGRLVTQEPLGCGHWWEGDWLSRQGSWMLRFTRQGDQWCKADAQQMGRMTEILHSNYPRGITWMGTREGQWSWIADGAAEGDLAIYQGPQDEHVTIIRSQPGSLEAAKPGPPFGVPQGDLVVPPPCTTSPP